jgi:hypothetical protein
MSQWNKDSTRPATTRHDLPTLPSPTDAEPYQTCLKELHRLLGQSSEAAGKRETGDQGAISDQKVAGEELLHSLPPTSQPTNSSTCPSFLCCAGMNSFEDCRHKVVGGGTAKRLGNINEFNVFGHLAQSGPLNSVFDTSGIYPYCLLSRHRFEKFKRKV